MKQLQKQQPGLKVGLRAGGSGYGYPGATCGIERFVSRPHPCQHAGCDTVTRALQGVTIGRHQVKGMWCLSIALQLQVHLQFSQDTSLIKKDWPREDHTATQVVPGAKAKGCGWLTLGRPWGQVGLPTQAKT